LNAQLTDKKRKVADAEAPIAEPVYAPASERVPVEPVPGHRDLTDQTDTHTPERASQAPTPIAPTPITSIPTPSAEPAFTRVTRPSDTATVSAPARDAYASTVTNPAYRTYDDSGWNAQSKSSGLPFGIGWLTVGVCGAVGGWLYLRWQRERNKPINRLRRQAKHAAGELRDRVPNSPEEAVRPAAGLGTALLSIAVILWQQSQARSRQAEKSVGRQTKKATKRADKALNRAGSAISDVDWQKRLSTLKKRWDANRLELEKISISRH
jgi:hypothetical protein